VVRLDLRQPITAVTDILSLITVTDGHDGGLRDSDCTWRPIRAQLPTRQLVQFTRDYGA